MFWKRRTYLDYAAGVAGNASSPHEEGRKAKQMLEGARTSIARLLEVQADDVIFTSGATEANALAILGHVRALRQNAGPDVPGRNNMHVLYLPSAHASIVENMKVLADEGVAVEALPISTVGGSASGGKNYRVDTDALAKMLRPETVLVSMDAVCGETGVIWNVRDVRKTIGTKILLHVDASQAPMTEKLTRAHFAADMLTLDASKVGPSHCKCGGRGIGALIAHRTIPLVPLYKGGGQERGLRPGSEAPELAREFVACLRQATRGWEKFNARAKRARIEIVERIKSDIPDVLLNESPSASGQASHILNISLPGRDTDYLVALMDEAGFAVSTRSACETDSETGSRAVLALTGDAERARATLRISWGPSVTPRELARFARELATAVTFIDNRGAR